LFRRVGRPPQDLSEPDWVMIPRELKRKGVTLTLLWNIAPLIPTVTATPGSATGSARSTAGRARHSATVTWRAR
jgi:hypothetical protein